MSLDNRKNLKVGDNYEDFQRQENQNIWLPPAELIEIPSHGLLYGGITNDPDILEKGSIRVRPMTIHEEKIISTRRIIRSGQAIDMVLKNVISSTGINGAPLDTEQLLSSDRAFIMLWLRGVSYGYNYKFSVQCTSCNQKFEQNVDLSKIGIKEFGYNEDGEKINTDGIKEPFTFVLPRSGYTVEYRLARGIDEIELSKIKMESKKIDDLDDSIVRRIHSLILNVYKGDDVVPKNKIKSFVENMIAGDASQLRQDFDNNDCGVKQIRNVTCPSCDYQLDDFYIPITESFFRSSE